MAAANEIEFGKLFSSLQEQLVAKLKAREVIGHPGAKGDASELDWVDMLGGYLPRRYVVSKAFVIDSKGHRSDQIDVVIYDRQYTPCMFKHEQALYVPAESVYAALEVKQDLSKGHIAYAGEKVASVRALQRTSADIPYAAGAYRPKPLHDILGGILCFESSWSPPFGGPFRESIGDLPKEQRLDLGCAITHGAFDVAYAENGAPVIDLNETDHALAFFFLRLAERLQKIGTVPAINLREYSAWLSDAGPKEGEQ